MAETDGVILQNPTTKAIAFLPGSGKELSL
jgi:hypothetical protein